MDYYINEISERKEEEQHIKESIVATKDAPFPKTIGGECREDKEEGDDHNTTLPMPCHPWTILPYQWIYPGAAHQITGEAEVAKEDGIKGATKEE